MHKIIISIIFISFFISGIHLSLADDNTNENIVQQATLLKLNSQYPEVLQDNKKQELIIAINKAQKQRIINNFIANKKQKESEFYITNNIVYPEFFDISDNMSFKSIQEKSLSCELSATSDIISHLENRQISETSIINMVDKSHYNQLPVIENGKTIWWNPNAGYVWNIHEVSEWVKATQSGMTGYWVLEKPISKIYDRFNYQNKIITQQNYTQEYWETQHLTELLQNINSWNMVQLWWDYCTNPQFEDTENINSCSRFWENRELQWYYKEDWELQLYTGLAWEHAFYLLGYKWWANNPTDIIVWDTKTGKHTYPISEWMRKWNAMDNKSIIIYKKK